MEINVSRFPTKNQYFAICCLEIIHSNENNSILDNPLLLTQIQILISFWSQKAENQKFKIEEKVMSEPVKMPGRHFLRRDYLHIFFYIKFLVFVSLVPQISYLIPHSHNCGFRVGRKKKKTWYDSKTAC